MYSSLEGRGITTTTTSDDVNDAQNGAYGLRLLTRLNCSVGPTKNGRSRLVVTEAIATDAVSCTVLGFLHRLTLVALDSMTSKLIYYQPTLVLHHMRLQRSKICNDFCWTRIPTSFNWKNGQLVLSEISLAIIEHLSLRPSSSKESLEQDLNRRNLENDRLEEKLKQYEEKVAFVRMIYRVSPFERHSRRIPLRIYIVCKFKHLRKSYANIKPKMNVSNDDKDDLN
jgi:hypothetical protein